MTCEKCGKGNCTLVAGWLIKKYLKGMYCHDCKKELEEKE